MKSGTENIRVPHRLPPHLTFSFNDRLCQSAIQALLVFALNLLQNQF